MVPSGPTKGATEAVPSGPTKRTTEGYKYFHLAGMKYNALGLQQLSSVLSETTINTTAVLELPTNHY